MGKSQSPYHRKKVANVVKVIQNTFHVKGYKV